MDYFYFLKNNLRFLSFGILLNFFSSIGQTYFVSVFGAEFRQEFNLTNGEFGFIFMLATVASAVSIIWLGRFIDKMDLRLYSFLICCGCVIAAYCTSLANDIISLFFVFYLLRLMGQGLMTHTAVTSMGRYFNEGRGKAISIIVAGNTLGIGFFPLFGVSLISWLGWRSSWIAISIICLTFLIPMNFWLLKGQKKRHYRYKEAKLATSRKINQSKRDYSVKSVLTELRFYLIMPALMASSFLLTGFLFHQVKIVETKGWELTIFASGFVGLAISLFSTSLLLGYLIDKWKAFRLLPFILFPLAIGLLLLSYYDSEIIGFLFLILVGISFGANVTISGVIWPELYGTKNLGAIKSISKSLMILSSALSPWVFGFLFDLGFNLREISYLSIGIILITGLLAKCGQFFQPRKYAR